MSFVEPLILAAIPLAGLPILIHLLNLRRYKSVEWGASMFLVEALRINRGRSRLRNWLILTVRTAALAGLILAISRPLASQLSGITGGLGGRSQIILLDRSPSMERRHAVTGVTQRETALARLGETFEQLGQPSKLILIDSATLRPTSLKNLNDAATLPDAGATAAAADIPAMLERAVDYIEMNSLGPTDVWICSDRQSSNWQPKNERWTELRQRLETLAEVRTLLLTGDDDGQFNLAVRIDNVRQVGHGASGELKMDLEVVQTSGSPENVAIPLTINVGGLSSVAEVKLVEGRQRHEGFAIPLGEDQPAGVGFLELPNDVNAADNRAYFAFAPPPRSRAVVVTDDKATADILQLAITTPSTHDAAAECLVISPTQVNALDWAQTALIAWQAPLPKGALAKQLEAFVEAGKTVIFLPPQPGDVTAAVPESDATLFGARWAQWQRAKQVVSDDGAVSARWSVKDWDRQSELFRNAETGEAMPVAELSVQQRRDVVCPTGATLAMLSDRAPLLIRAATAAGNAYFLATLPGEAYSNFTHDGIVLYVLVQRALADGARTFSAAQQLTAGKDAPADIAQWATETLASNEILLSERPYQAGVYSLAGRYLALNRPAAEDDVETVAVEEAARLLPGRGIEVVAGSAGEVGTLASEVWKAFVMLMIVGLIVEGWLSLPKTQWARREPAAVDADAPPRQRRVSELRPAIGGSA